MGKLNLLNVPGIIFMYIGFGSASAIFLYHGFGKSIPKELDEAALIDVYKRQFYNHYNLIII